MKDAFYIAAKAPRAGFVKTRLGREIGHERAVAFYGAFLADLAARFEAAPFSLGWYVTPPDAWADVAPLVGGAGRYARVLDQGEGDWAERQGRLFCGAEARGEERVVLVASDSPHLSVAVVEGAFRELRRHDLVLGPVHDGGYYLIGMRAPATRHDVLGGVSMSTATVLGDVVARAESFGLSVGRVESTFDVDEAGDLERLRPLALTRDDLPATRAAFSKAFEPPGRAVPEKTDARTLQEV